MCRKLTSPFLPHGFRPRRCCLALFLGLAFATPASAVIHIFTATLAPTNECPACGLAAPGANGTGALTLDTTTHMVSYNISFSGLSSPENNAHVHGPATQVPCVSAGVLFPLPLGTPKIGSYGPLTIARENDMIAGLHYVNVHSNNCGGGEIRGQIVLENRACCLQGGLCITTTFANCTQQGGAWQAPGSVCTTLQACCMPDNSCLDLDPICCTAQGGTPKGPGSNCAQDPCYKNWVIADDFCIAPCPNCRCDVNGDGLCDQNDLNCINSCIFGPAICDCSRADLNCDGVVSNIDIAILQCFLAGGTNCCSQFPGGNPPVINHVRWYGSYLDPQFDPAVVPAPRPVDGWLVGLYSDTPPPAPCPAGSTYDACGTIGGTAACPTFKPDGSALYYTIQVTPTCLPPLPPIPPIGTRTRICGNISTACQPCDPLAIGCLCPLQFQPCSNAISQPNRLLAQWVFPPAAVTLMDSGKTGCDNHRIWCYDVDLIAGCLEHNILPLQVFPDRFFPTPNTIYWLSVQAEVGHQPCCPGCPPLASPTINNDFWGWHTTPPGYNRKDDAFMGQLKMGCFAEWIYNWMSHMHWSNYLTCADDPTKSMDMSFYLIDRTPLGDTIHWCQPIMGGPPPIGPPYPPIRPFPDAGVDYLANTVADAQIFFPPPGPGLVTLGGLTGPTLVRRSAPFPLGTTDVIDTEIISMSLTGNGPFGPVHVIDFPGQLLPGRITGPLGDPYPADSFFDVFVRIDMPGAPPGFQNLYNQLPARVQTTIHEVPPTMATYTGPTGGPVLLYDTSNPAVPVAQLQFVRHIITDRLGVDIHSDIDWRIAPMVCTCLGDINGDLKINGLDIGRFIKCLLDPGLPPLSCPCLCADIDQDGFVTLADVNPFVNLLLFGPNVCP